MHIPDGYLSPSTSLIFYTVCTPFIAKASKEVRKKLDSKTVPLISLFSALSFVIMMFNVPLPGGTTGHAVGATIASIILGPWVAMLSVTVALLIQALFFGDGGILTLGANIFNMAIVISIAGYAIYHFLDRFSNGDIKRKVVFSALSGYIAINLAALCAGLELGIQPLLFHNNLGQSLYFPYSLKVSVPAMLIGHLTLAGIAEALVTGLTLSWIYRTNPELILEKKKTSAKKGNFFKWGTIILGLLILLSPLGLLAPGTAWGEWGRAELQHFGLGYIPVGFDKWTGLWKAPLKNYNFILLGNQTLGYIFSALMGVIMISVVIWGTYWVVRKIYNYNHPKIINHVQKGK